MTKIRTVQGTYVEDITGQTFGRLTVLELTDKKDNDNRWVWKCVCSCENRTIVYTSMHKLKSKNTKSCGCLQKEKVIAKNKAGTLDLSGQKFGMLTAIEIDSNRRGSHGEIYWKCKCDCGNYTSVALGELRRGLYGNDKRPGTQSCGCSSKSVGENRIKEILKKLNINFEREKTFEDCINPDSGRRLRFDFYLPEYNCCIEYDGYTHFSSNGGWNTEENLAKIQHSDTLKNEYCANNYIKLIRIPYTDFKKINSDYILEKIKEENE